MNSPRKPPEAAHSSNTLLGLNKGTLLVAFVFLALVCILVQASRVFPLYFTSGDDIYMGTLAERIKAKGWTPYWHDTDLYADWQGRPYFYVNFFFFVLPYLTHSAVLRTLLVVLVQMATIGAMAWFLSLYLDLLGGMLFAAMVLCLLPQWPTVHPLTAHLVVYQMPVLLFFGGLGLYVAALRKPTAPYAISALRRAAGLGMILGSLLFYEALYAPFFLIAICAVAADLPGRPHTGGWREFFRRVLPIFGVFAAWSGVYVVYRFLHPSYYEGSALAPFDPGSLVSGVMQNVLKSLPGANLVHLPWAEWNASARSSTAMFDLLLANLSVTGLLQAIGLAALVLFAARYRAGTDSESLPGRRWLGAAASLALLAGLLAPIPLELTQKHANMDWSLRPYLPGYFQYLAFCGFLTVGLISVHRLRRPALQAMANAGLAFVLAALTLTGSIANDRIDTLLANNSRQWKLVDLLCRSGALNRLPAGATILAPTLWQNIDPDAWSSQYYWSRYVEARTKHKFRFVRTPNDLGENISKEHPALIYCEHLWLPGRASSALLLSSELKGTGTRRTADRVTIVTDRDLPGSELVYETPNSGAARADVAGIPICPWGIHRHGCLAEHGHWNRPSGAAERDGPDPGALDVGVWLGVLDSGKRRGEVLAMGRRTLGRGRPRTRQQLSPGRESIF